MKAKKAFENLRQKQNWWDKQPQSYKNSHRRPGSIKTA